jgi:hypothetical protein
MIPATHKKDFWTERLTDAAIYAGAAYASALTAQGLTSLLTAQGVSENVATNTFTNLARGTASGLTKELSYASSGMERLEGAGFASRMIHGVTGSFIANGF